ncbi:MAG: carboxypeptidase-like regulatory domain-containing protein [Candidatus Sulfotelmatobacter sp.]
MSRRIAKIVFVVCVGMLSSQLWAQTTTTGELSGVVSDPTGAVLTSAAITLTNTASGATQSTQSNSTGFYRFALLQPGTYTVSASASGFQGVEKRVEVGLGTSVSANLQLAVGTGHVTVEVSAATTSLETEDANLNTNFVAQQVEFLPNPGNDLSAVALTSPGAVMNTAGGSQFGGGNFELFGLPATSNLFTVDGANYNDPYFNVNNSGATNLTLGLNDVQESAVVANGYSGSYGGLAGANINYVTKSGGNQFHGNLEYWWNGSVLDANEYFRNQQGQPRAFVNANQFAGSIGGPIKKDKAFFFFDYEALYLAIPSPLPVQVPTPAFQTAVIGNLNANGLSASVPFYNQVFNVYNGLSQAGASPIGGGGCSDVTTVNGIAFGAANPCAVTVQAAASAHTHDLYYVGRYDQNIGSRDKLFVRLEREHGLQATFTDPFSSAFNVISDQPQWQSNFQETHAFGTDKVNSFNASLLWYSAGFAMQHPAEAASSLTGLPGGTLTLSPNDGSLSALNPDNFLIPQGRNITQYQFVDDFSWVRGRHTFKVGANFRRDDISDQNFVFITPLVLPLSLSAFASGGAGGPGSLIVQNFPSKTEEPIALYQLGGYGADDIRVTSNLKVTLSLRLDHLSNPVCQTNCFQHFAGTFGTLDTSAPVNQAIVANQHTAFPSVSAVVVQPKIGFAWSPFGGARNTVIRGGAGIFADALPTGAIDSFMAQAPLDPQFVSGGAVPISPAESGNLFVASQASNAGFRSNYASGGAVAPFSFYNSTAVKVPRYYEWSLELQQGLGWNTTMSVMYVGNHGSHEEISNTALNAFSPTPFANLPASAPDPRFGVVSQQQNIANSNYSGLVATMKHSLRGGLTFQASYTWSHSLDEISNNSLSPFGLNTTGRYADIINPQDPFDIRAYNYGNSDYDIRNNFTANYVWSDGLRHLTSWGPNALMKGWSFSGTVFWHGGLPFTVVSSNVTGLLEGSNYGAGGGTQQVFADVMGPTTASCGASAAKITSSGTAASPCLVASNFADPTNNWGQQRRNQFRGPGFFDTDFAVEKAFGIPKWESAQFSIGARFFNIFNHPNFYFPVMNLDSTQFGQIIQTVSSPTSIFGSGLGANASPRLIQLQAKFVF